MKFHLQIFKKQVYQYPPIMLTSFSGGLYILNAIIRCIMEFAARSEERASLCQQLRLDVKGFIMKFRMSIRSVGIFDVQVGKMDSQVGIEIIW